MMAVDTDYELRRWQEGSCRAGPNKSYNTPIFIIYDIGGVHLFLPVNSFHPTTLQ